MTSLKLIYDRNLKLEISVLYGFCVNVWSWFWKFVFQIPQTFYEKFSTWNISNNSKMFTEFYRTKILLVNSCANKILKLFDTLDSKTRERLGFICVCMCKAYMTILSIRMINMKIMLPMDKAPINPLCEINIEKMILYDVNQSREIREKMHALHFTLRQRETN